MRLILFLVLSVVVLLGLALVLMWLPLPRPIPPAMTSARTMMAAVTVGTLGLVILAGVTVLTVDQLSRAGRRLDEVLALYGLAPAHTLFLGRAYDGSLQGRSVRASWVSGYGVHPGQLLVRADADVGFVAAVGNLRPLRPSLDAVRVEAPTQDGWTPVALVEADEAASFAGFLANPTVASALFQLLASSEPGGVRELRLAQDHLSFRARPSVDAVVQHAGTWVQALVVLAAHLDRAERSR